MLEEKLHGSKKESSKGLACSHCTTPLEQILTGGPVGCSECYTVFEKQIFSDLVATDSIPSFLQKKKELLHVGRAPHQAKAPPLPSKLLALKEALTDALRRENYEQAAFIRDQIKTLSQEKS
jgi:protein arginine kinase activator